MRWTYRPSLDGLRALAMYLIVLFHTAVPGVGGSFIAVNLFFVLSGYLVANVILHEVDATGRLRLGVFYARRVRRLLPAALVAVVGTSIVFLLLAPVVERTAMLRDGQSALLYFANWHFIGEANDYFASSVDQSPFLHFWTLSIEEQFYLVFPLLLVLLARRGGHRLMLAVLGAVTVLSVAAQVYWSHADPIHAYYGTDARLYQLSAGAVLAVAMRYWDLRLRPGAASFVGLASVGAFLVLSTDLLDLGRTTRGIVGTLLCVSLVAALMSFEKQWLGRVLSHRVPVYLGTVSYATYLWHWPIVLVLRRTLGVGPWAQAVIVAVLATALAALSAELLEHPVRRSRLLDKVSWPVVAAGLTASVLVAAAVVPGVLRDDRRPALLAGRGSGGGVAAAAAVEQLPKGIDWKKVDQERGRSYTCGPHDPESCVAVRGSGATVVVVGDSHARMLSQMFSDLARKHHFTLAMNDLPNCAWQENLEVTSGSKAEQDDCTEARVGWYDKVLPKLDPDLVIVASFPRDDDPGIKERDGRSDAHDAAILRATRQSVQKIARTGARTMIIQNLIVPRTFDPNECLTSKSDAKKCLVPLTRAQAATNGYFQTLATERSDTFAVDLNSAFCPAAPLCHPVEDGQLVWRNNRHFTPGYADSRRHEVWRLMKKAGVLDGLELT